jgi:hypothetical protein
VQLNQLQSLIVQQVIGPSDGVHRDLLSSESRV